MQMCRDPRNELTPKEYIVFSAEFLFQTRGCKEPCNKALQCTYEFGSHMTTEQRTNTVSTAQCRQYCINEIEIGNFVTLFIVRIDIF